MSKSLRIKLDLSLSETQVLAAILEHCAYDKDKARQFFERTFLDFRGTEPRIAAALCNKVERLLTEAEQKERER